MIEGEMERKVRLAEHVLKRLESITRKLANVRKEAKAYKAERNWNIFEKLMNATEQHPANIYVHGAEFQAAKKRIRDLEQRIKELENGR